MMKLIVCLKVLQLLLLPHLINAQFTDEYNSFDLLKSTANETYNLRHSIPGEPEIDYPIYAYPVRTSFSCENRHEGYYADVEARCQLFRICTNTATSSRGFAFLCPNGTLFSQVNFVCDWYKNVDCTESENYYFKNEHLGTIVHDEILETVKEMVEYPIKQNQRQNNQSKIQAKINRNQNAANKQRFDADIHNNNNNVDAGLKKIENIPKIDIRLGNDGAKTNIATNSQFNRNEKNTNKVFESIQEQFKVPLTTTTNRPLSLLNINQKQPNINNVQNSRGTEKFVLPSGKVFVNRLGELSTDPSANFDPKTAIILGQNSDEIFNNQKKSSSKNEIDNLLVQTKLNFAAGVNAGLNEVSSGSQSRIDYATLVPEYVAKRLNKQNELKKINPASPLTFRNLADNVNVELNHVSSSTLNPITTELYNFRKERQFQLLGAGFTKSLIESSTTPAYNSYLKVNPNDFANRGQNPFQIPSRSFQLNSFTAERSPQQETNFKNLLLDINSINLPNQSPPIFDEDESLNSENVHVKKRAEKLLLQGVHQAKYESNETDNSILDSNETPRMLIRVYDDDYATPETSTKATTTTTTTTFKTVEENNKPISLLRNTINLRRQFYSKKPYTIRSYLKTTAATTKPRTKYLDTNRRNRFRNRFPGDYSSTDQQDLTAVANTYGANAGVRNQIQNTTRNSLLRRRPLTRNKFISTTTKPFGNNHNFTGGISNFVPFGNLQSNDNKLQLTNNQFSQNILSKPSSTYTQIPGTNIKISKSNEEATYILSSDPRQQLQQLPSNPVTQQKNGYISFNDYITKTLNGEIRNLAAQSQPTTYSNTNNYAPVQSNTLPSISHFQQNSQFNLPQISTGKILQQPLISPSYTHQRNSQDNDQIIAQNAFNNNNPKVNNIVPQKSLLQNSNNLLFNQYSTNSFANNQKTQNKYPLVPEVSSTNINFYNNLAPDGLINLPFISNNRYIRKFGENYPQFDYNGLPLL